MPLHVRTPEGSVLRWYSRLHEGDQATIILLGGAKAVFVPAPERMFKHLGRNFLVLDREKSDKRVIAAMDARKPTIYDTPIPWWRRMFNSMTQQQWKESIDVAIRPTINYRSDSFGGVCYELYIGRFLPVEFVVSNRWFVAFCQHAWPGVKEILQSGDVWKSPHVTDVQVTAAP